MWNQISARMFSQKGLMLIGFGCMIVFAMPEANKADLLKALMGYGFVANVGVKVVHAINGKLAK